MPQSKAGTFLARVHGNSMNLTYTDGMIVRARRRGPARDGDAVIVATGDDDGSAVIKRLRILLASPEYPAQRAWLFPESTEPQWLPCRLDGMRIVGVVIDPIRRPPPKESLPPWPEDAWNIWGTTRAARRLRALAHNREAALAMIAARQRAEAGPLADLR